MASLLHLHGLSGSYRTIQADRVFVMPLVSTPQVRNTVARVASDCGAQVIEVRHFK